MMAAKSVFPNLFVGSTIVALLCQKDSAKDKQQQLLLLQGIHFMTRVEVFPAYMVQLQTCDCTSAKKNSSC